MGASESTVAAVRGIDEKLCLFYSLTGQVPSGATIPLQSFICLEKEICKFTPGVFVVKQLRVAKALVKLGKNRTFLFWDVGVLRFDQPLSGMNHRGVSRLNRLPKIPTVKVYLRLEKLAFTCREGKLCLGNNLSSTFSNTHVGQCELSRVPPNRYNRRGPHCAGGSG